MPSLDSLKKRRTRKITWSIALALGLFCVFRFFWMRTVDTTAWPSPPSPTPSLIPVVAQDDATRAHASTLTNLVAAFPPSSAALIAQYHAFQAQGLSVTSDYPAIFARLAETQSARDQFFACCSQITGFDSSQGALPYHALSGLSAEITLLGCFEIALKHPTHRAQFSDSSTDSSALLSDCATPCQSLIAQRIALLKAALKLTQGGGTLNRAAALNNTMLVVREQIMLPSAAFDATVLQSTLQEIRDLETQIGPLTTDIQADWISLQESITSLYSQINATQTRNPSAARFSGRSAWIVRMLGATEALTQSNLENLFFHLVHNATQPYQANGLFQNLPSWCYTSDRPPWTRDPVGVALSSAYLKNAALGYAAGPGILLELRALRLALTLQYLQAQGIPLPQSLEELLRQGFLIERDLLDPFSPAPHQRLHYAVEGQKDWRFYSVGPNQIDDGGQNDLYRPNANTKKAPATDIVYTSHERMARLATYKAPAATVPAATSSTNTPPTERP